MTKALLTEKKCTGRVDEPGVHEPMADFQMLLSVTEWTGENSSVTSKSIFSGASAECGSYRQLRKHIHKRYEEGLAFLKNGWNGQPRGGREWSPGIVLCVH